MTFGESARRLAGFAGVAFGWPPDLFWGATPAELAALVMPDTAAVPPDAATIARLQGEHPDG